MEMLSKKNSARFFLPKADFQVKEGVRGCSAFFEGEPIDLSSHPIFGRHGISCGYDTFKYLSKREIAH